MNIILLKVAKWTIMILHLLYLIEVFVYRKEIGLFVNPPVEIIVTGITIILSFISLITTYYFDSLIETAEKQSKNQSDES